MGDQLHARLLFGPRYELVLGHRSSSGTLDLRKLLLNSGLRLLFSILVSRQFDLEVDGLRLTFSMNLSSLRALRVLLFRALHNRRLADCQLLDLVHNRLSLHEVIDDSASKLNLVDLAGATT